RGGHGRRAGRALLAGVGGRLPLCRRGAGSAVRLGFTQQPHRVLLGGGRRGLAGGPLGGGCRTAQRGLPCRRTPDPGPAPGRACWTGGATRGGGEESPRSSPPGDGDLQRRRRLGRLTGSGRGGAALPSVAASP